MAEQRRVNRGPGAAAANRTALIAAAREVFAESGFDAPLSLIARRAGVGQGSLYRHFADREALALAVFEDNVVGLETYAAQPDTGIDQMLELIVDQVVTSIAFVELIDPPLTGGPLAGMSVRVGAMLAGLLERARDRGEIRADLTAADLMLALSMLAALLARAAPHDRARTAEHGWALIRRGLDA
ncbi:putative transcriptional regulator, TetR family [Nocardia nova SH22a]|uniref:Putative transcriptional regulator, TetR family n=1 Tax=Nocardia nova SH22a TaxID=1415166 RepID=W5TIF5_9NOCA|nr:helix-turn-helix domain-containing protein [Nocardia nova]AHH19022.1 putative transcriptional regulator, TetR family [Nocardia nova SH22a]